MGALFHALFFLFILAVVGVTIAGVWATFVKAGHPGWAAIVPIFNVYIMTQIAGKPAWWLLLCLLPCISIIFVFILMMEIAKAFGKDIGYAVGLFLLPMVFWPLLGFGDATYQGKQA